MQWLWESSGSILKKSTLEIRFSADFHQTNLSLYEAHLTPLQSEKIKAVKNEEKSLKHRLAECINISFLFLRQTRCNEETISFKSEMWEFFSFSLFLQVFRRWKLESESGIFLWMAAYLNIHPPLQRPHTAMHGSYPAYENYKRFFTCTFMSKCRLFSLWSRS